MEPIFNQVLQALKACGAREVQVMIRASRGTIISTPYDDDEDNDDD